MALAQSHGTLYSTTPLLTKKLSFKPQHAVGADQDYIIIGFGPYEKSGKGLSTGENYRRIANYKSYNSNDPSVAEFNVYIANHTSYPIDAELLIPKDTPNETYIICKHKPVLPEECYFERKPYSSKPANREIGYGVNEQGIVVFGTPCKDRPVQFIRHRCYATASDKQISLKYDFPAKDLAIWRKIEKSSFEALRKRSIKY